MKFLSYIWYQNWTVRFGVFLVIQPSLTSLSILGQFIVKVRSTPPEYDVYLLLSRKKNRKILGHSFFLFSSFPLSCSFPLLLFWILFLSSFYSRALFSQKTRVRLSLRPIFWRDISVVVRVGPVFFAHADQFVVVQHFLICRKDSRACNLVMLGISPCWIQVVKSDEVLRSPVLSPISFH